MAILILGLLAKASLYNLTMSSSVWIGIGISMICDTMPATSKFS